MAWLYRSDQKILGNRRLIFVAGHSAGSHQVARLPSTDWDDDYGPPGDLIKLRFAISGLFDLRPRR